MWRSLIDIVFRDQKRCSVLPFLVLGTSKEASETTTAPGITITGKSDRK
jgi:hypothetical protein